MKVAFICNEHVRERMLYAAFSRGVEKHGDELELGPSGGGPRDLGCDAVAFIGMKGREWQEHCRRTGQRFIYFDKGYYYPKPERRPVVECWRVAVDATQPLEHLQTQRRSLNRWDRIGPRPKPWRTPTRNGHILIAGSSRKYHEFHGLPYPTDYFTAMVAELRRWTDRPIHYRPKPSWREAVPIDGTEFAMSGPFRDRLKHAHVVITHGSNAALVAMLHGVPSIVLGNGVMRLISSTDLFAVEEPYLAPEEERLQLLANLAWSQFTLREFEDGTAWAEIRPQLQ